MEELIPLINKLQSVFKNTGIQLMQEINLPQIVVIGPQSSGKSSVLESLVRKPFLPRGTGIVTRCPIILQLHQIKSDPILQSYKNAVSHEPEEWCVFERLPDQKFTDFDEVREQIEKFQEELAGDKKGISLEPIILQVNSPKVIDLTVVDLPGIVHLAMEGQAEDIEKQVLDMINKYISNPSAIILAVSPATADIATSESIKIAKQVDPRGERTLAVLTKLDAMEAGTDATDVLIGKVYPVKLGIVGVVNRSQQDINNNLSVEDAIRKEEAFLKDKYPHIHGIGSSYLARRLNIILKEHIHKNLPDLIKRIGSQIESCEKELGQLGPEISSDPSQCQWLILETTMKFLGKFEEMVKYRPKLAPQNGVKTFGVAVNEVFTKLRGEIEIELVDCEILQAYLKNTQNVEGFSSIEEVFKSVVKENVKLMKTTALDCAQSVHDVISENIYKCLDAKRLSKLNNIIRRVVDDLLLDQLKHLKFAIGEYIKMQTNMIFSSDPEFLNMLSRETESVFIEDDEDDVITAFPLTTEFTQDESKTLHVQKLIEKYLIIVKQRLSDYVPMTAMYHLAQETLKKMNAAVKKDTIGKEAALVAEPEIITIQRKQLQEQLQNLKEGMRILKDVRASG